MLDQPLKSQTLLPLFLLTQGHDQNAKMHQLMTLSPVYWWELTMQRPASRHTLQSVLAFWLPAAVQTAQLFRSDLRGPRAQAYCKPGKKFIKKLQGNKQMLRKAGDCRGLSTIESDQKSEVIHMPRAISSTAPHPLCWEVNSPQSGSESGMSTLITARLMSFKKAGVTHCIRGRDISLRQVHPLALWGNPTNIPGHRKQTSSSEGICFQCREKERTRRGSRRTLASQSSTIRGNSCSEEGKASNVLWFKGRSSCCRRQRKLSLDSLGLAVPSNLPNSLSGTFVLTEVNTSYI